MGGDEINLPMAGANFGWPLVSHGRNYNYTSVGTGERSHPGTLQPLHTWVPSIAPSGMAFVSSERYGPDWLYEHLPDHERGLVMGYAHLTESQIARGVARIGDILGAWTPATSSRTG
eukprot:gene1653-biopygen1194